MKKRLLSFGLLLSVATFGFAASNNANDAPFLASNNVGTKAVGSTVAAVTVSGTIKDEKGEPLVGASVVQKGTANGAVTDLDGRFSVTVPDGKAILVISFVGYETQEVTVGGSTKLDIVLKEGSALSEVIVVGYGTQKKSQTTGAISSINSRQLTEMPITSLGQALQGRVAGVDVVQSGSKPGAVPTIRVRLSTFQSQSG